MKTGLTKWVLAVGTRPNFMKVAPLIREIGRFNAENRGNNRKIDYTLVHTGQHYDDNMSDRFFKDLELPAADVNLGVGSAMHGEQTAKILSAFEKLLLDIAPDLLIVVGDVNSTLACALAAVKLHIPVAHVEAGLRSFDRRMPEEINRVVTDVLSDYLFIPSPEGEENLAAEGISAEKRFLVGDVMVDTLFHSLEKARNRPILDGWDIGPYALLTLHRPANVDDRDRFSRILQGLQQVSVTLPIVFPLHPRTRRRIDEFAMASAFCFTDSLDGRAIGRQNTADPRIYGIRPVGYLDFLCLMVHATVVLTDSGGIQQETTVLDVPCVTLRDTTERPITLTKGTNVLVDSDPDRIVEEVARVLRGKRAGGERPKIWDGRSAERIVQVLAERMMDSS